MARDWPEDPWADTTPARPASAHARRCPRAATGSRLNGWRALVDRYFSQIDLRRIFADVGLKYTPAVTA